MQCYYVTDVLDTTKGPKPYHETMKVKVLQHDFTSQYVNDLRKRCSISKW